MRVWITKYALTDGFYTAEAEDCGDGLCVIRGNGRTHFDQYFHGKDWHQEKESARVRFREMKGKKIVSLQKQLKRVESLEFIIVKMGEPK